MSDGVRLSARAWLPADAEQGPVPAILEYIPYRKGDATAPRDLALHGELAKHGFACVRVDLRGSGDSEGVLGGEYLAAELDDGLEVIAWLAEQTWCNGRVGMIGKSWGGFNGLQLAALAPPALHCVVSVCSTDDRYRDDVHYTGGCVFAQAALSWSTTMLAYTARPPDPRVVGEGWREQWLGRLEALEPFGHKWLAHQRRDAFWRHGSVCENPDAIGCPVYMVGGWADPYRGAILRMLSAAPHRVRGLIGPWAHVYPHEGRPGPPIGFLELCRRLFDRHLRDVGPGLDGEPALRAWMQEAVPPRPNYEMRPGRWVAEPGWPPSGKPLQLHLTVEGLRTDPGETRTISHEGLLAHGSDGPTWLPWGASADFAPDQRSEDGRSLTFDSEPLEERVEIMGEPTVEVELLPESTTGQLTARLCDVAEDGASTLITLGLLNLCHHDDHAAPRGLVPGEPVRARLTLTAIACALPAGHRIRLALSPCYWPWAWPAAGSLRFHLLVGPHAVLELPVRLPRPEDELLPPLPDIAPSPPPEHEQLAPVEIVRSTSRDLASGLLQSTSDVRYFGSFRLPDALEYVEQGQDIFTAVEGAPLSAEARSRWEIGISRDTWQTKLVVQSSMRGDETTFHLQDELEAFEAGALVFSRRWNAAIPRDHT